MTRLHFGKRVITLLCFALVGLATQASHGDLTRKQIKILESEFLPAWNVGNTFGVLESLNKAVRTMDESQLSELDDLLAKQDIPSSSRILLESRLMLLQQNFHGKLPKPGIQELLMTLEYISDEVGSLINDSVTLIDALDGLDENTTFGNFEDLLWDTHVMTQQVQSSIFLAQYAVDALDSRNRYKVDQLDEKEKELIESDFSVFVDELKTIQQDLGEHEIVARIDRLKHARKVLGDENVDRKEQFLAARSVDQDGHLILEMLKTAGEVEFRHAVLKDGDLVNSVQSISARGIELAGDELLTKSRLLFEGLHWWYRGRYGMGTDAFGLLKSPAAVTSDAVAFALMMPEKTPTPTNPEDTSKYQIPEIDRRHHYIWAWEYRKVMVNSSSTTKAISPKKTLYKQKAVLSRFY